MRPNTADQQSAGTSESEATADAVDREAIALGDPQVDSGAQAAGDAVEAIHGRPEVFRVSLDNFEGPFDLLLSLIAKHKMDITEIALAQVTDDFISHIAVDQWDLGQASEFLVVAATLLDLKAARLLPVGEVDDADDLELLEARDLLFARLLQYRAFREVADAFRARLESEAGRRVRSVGLEAQFAALLPELVWQIGPEELARIAANALKPKPAPPGVELGHMHSPAVSVRSQAATIVDRLRRDQAATFRALISDANTTAVVVARFLALLELFREGVIGFDQVEPLADLTVRWTGTDEGEIEVDDEYDDIELSSEAPLAIIDDEGDDSQEMEMS